MFRSMMIPNSNMNLYFVIKQYVWFCQDTRAYHFGEG